MATFTITGEEDPFLHVSLRQGEKIFCESNSMVMMEANLELKGKMNGGFAAALMRRFANGESFFQQEIVAVNGSGDCLLASSLPGAMQVLEVGANQYMLSDGAFVAAESGVELKVRTQNIGNALFANTGGFFLMETSGQGQLAIGGFGSVFVLDVEPGKDVVIDNAHVVCWDSRLRYELSMATSNKNTGFLGNLVNSLTSGEGIVLRFSGAGKVMVCSRNRESFLSWISSKVTGQSS